MPLEKIPAILLIGLGIHISLTPPTPPIPKNEQRIGDGPVDINWLVRVIKASNLATFQRYEKSLTSPQGRILDSYNHRTLHRSSGNEARVHLVKGSYGVLVAERQTFRLHQNDSDHYSRDDPGGVGSRDPVLVLSRAGTIFHVPYYPPEKSQARYDWSLQYCSPPFLYWRPPDGCRAADLVYRSRVVAEGEYDL